MSLIETKEVKFYSSVDDFPKVGNELCVADGVLYAVSGGVNRSISGTFTPSIYSGIKSASTNVSGQSEAIATGASLIQVANKDATNSVYIGFGMSASSAEAACSSGVAGVNRFLLLADSIMLQFIGEYTYYAWLGVGGTVSVRITQGV